MPFTLDENERNSAIRDAATLQGSVAYILAMLAAGASPLLIAGAMLSVRNDSKELLKQFAQDATD